MLALAGGTLISADRVITGEGPDERGWVWLDGARIGAIGAGPPPRPPDHDFAGCTLVPGFVDVHTHGGGGASYHESDPTKIELARRTHLGFGTTSTVASIATASVEEMTASTARLADLVEAGMLAGIHLEGPFLSQARCGVHPPHLLRPADPATLTRLLNAGRGTVRMVTLAPEIPGGLPAVRQVVDAGVVAAVGHTDATYELTLAALDAGATHATHLFNGMRSLHHREPGPVMALVGRPEVTIELIADGVHLHPAVVAGVVSAVGCERVAAITDAMAAAGAGDGDYELAGQRVQVRDGVSRVWSDGTIAGSTLTMDRAVRWMVQVAGISLGEAVQMATATPAAALGLDEVGRLAPGTFADIVVLDGALEVVAVFARGRNVLAERTSPAGSG